MSELKPWLPSAAVYASQKKKKKSKPSVVRRRHVMENSLLYKSLNKQIPGLNGDKHYIQWVKK